MHGYQRHGPFPDKPSRDHRRWGSACTDMDLKPAACLWSDFQVAILCIARIPSFCSLHNRRHAFFLRLHPAFSPKKTEHFLAVLLTFCKRFFPELGGPAKSTFLERLLARDLVEPLV